MHARRPRPFRPMRRARWIAALNELERDFPWAGEEIRPSPGHLDLVRQFLTGIERVLRGESWVRLKQLSIFDEDGSLNVICRTDFIQPESDAVAASLINALQTGAEQTCAICGRSPANPGEVRGTKPGFCPEHRGLQGRTAEDLRRRQRLPVLDSRGDPSLIVRSPAEHKPLPRSPEIERLVSDFLDPANRAPDEPVVRVLNISELEVFKRNALQRKEQAGRAELIANRIVGAGGALRRLGILREPWHTLTDDFEAAFPNFYLMAELLRDQLALTELGDRRITLPPVLLVGPPGIGKTEAAHWLADRLKLPFRVFDLATAQSNSQLSGSEAFWSNSTEGGVFEMIAYREQANPLVVLDELDKAAQLDRYNPMSSLYTLLEPRSAARFVDLSIRDIKIDASHINWIATANSAEPIPSPIRSRLTVIEVPAPSLQQSRTIACSIYRALRSNHDWGEKFPLSPSAEVVEKLHRAPPRSMRAVLMRAFGMSARAGRREIISEDVITTSPCSTPSIGFLRLQGDRS
jgi:ATP-dependent Lon protease